MFVVTHKKIEKAIPERILIGVGGKQIDGVEYYDNSGINITSKNPQYCELTAIYWIWKNYSANYIGIEHYRRQFIKNGSLLAIDDIREKLKNYDIIVSNEINSSCNVYHAYVRDNSEEELIIVRNIIAEKYPDYLPYYDRLKKTNKYCVCNMMITNKHIFDDYCSWLFDILFSLEEKIDITDRKGQQQRMFGFLSERLLNVYLWKNNSLKIYHNPISEPLLKSPTQKFLVSREIKYIVKKIINYKGFYR